MKQNFIKLILTILIFIIIGFFLNFYIDSYGVLGNNLEYQKLEPNQNYMKTKYILENPQKFNAFIFGSSRVGYIPTEEIKNYTFYNMTYSEGVPKEWQQTLKLLIENGITPQIIILGIDDFDFKVNPLIHEKQLMRKPFNKVNILKDYILINPFTKYNFIKLKNIIFSKKVKDFRKDFMEHGRLSKEIREIKEREIKNNEIEHLAKKEFKLNNEYSRLKNVEENQAINSILEIKDLCKQNEIKLIVLFNPVHPRAYENNEAKNEYREIRARIKKSLENTTIYDFAEDEITKNNLYWFEASHFTTEVGRMMLKKIKELKI